MKPVWIILGILCLAYGFAQGLQAMGLLGGHGPSIPGISFMLLGFALGISCIQKAFATGESTGDDSE